MNIGTLEEAFLSDLAIKVVSGLAKKGYDWLKGDAQPYHVELYKVINSSIELYRQQYSENESDNIFFVDSETFVEELLNYRFELPFDSIKLKSAIESDSRIQVPSESDIENFLNIFNEQLAASQKLKQLYIDDNYKSLTFSAASGILQIQSKLDELIRQTRQNVGSLEIEHALAAEWVRELEIIRQLLYQFKPLTAASLIDNLQERIALRNIKNDLLESQLTFLKASAISDQENFAVTPKVAPLFVKAYRLSPYNTEYKRYAALGYMSLQEMDQALSLAGDLLASDEFDITAWSVKLHYAEDAFAFLDLVPKSVLERKEFRLNAFFTLAKYPSNLRKVHQPGSHLRIDLNDSELPQLSYANFKFWLRYSDYLFSRLYFEFPMITNYAESEELKESPLYGHYFKLLDLLVKTTQTGELTKQLAYIRFRHHYADLILTGDQAEIHQLSRTYEEIEQKDHIQVVQLVQAFSLIETDEYRLKALEVIDRFGACEHEMLALFKTVILFNARKYEEAITFYEDYILGLSEISTLIINNLLQFFRMAYRQQPERALVFLQKLLKGAGFPNQEMKDLLELYVRSIYAAGQLEHAGMQETLDRVEAGLDPEYPEIRDFYLATLRSLKDWGRIIRFLRPASGQSVVQHELLPYCEALFYGEGNKTELLQALKKARQGGGAPHTTLLRMEIEMRQKQRDWKKVLELSELAIQQPGPHADFIIAFFHACLNELAIDKIIAYQQTVKGISFHERGNLVIFSAFSQAGLHQEAIEVLFNSAKDIANIASRQAFVGSTLRSAEGVFKVYDEVVPGSYVTYNTSGQTFKIYIDPGKLDDTRIKPFLARKTNEHFQLYGLFMEETVFVHITRITDQYLDLYDEILAQAANPVSGLNFKQIRFDGDTPEEMTASLQRQFGAMGSMDHQFMEENLRRYNEGQLTFTEVVKGNFRTNPPDAYYVLTGEQQTLFQTLPQTVPHEPLTEATKYVLDFTGVVLFYELSKEHRLEYPTKFVVSGYVVHKLKHLLNQEENEREERMSVSITMEAFIPHFFPEDYKEKRTTHLRSLLDWVQENCIEDHVDEKLDLVLNERDRAQEEDDYLHYLVDNRLLSLRPAHLLISSDLFYLKVFGGLKTIIGPELYLQQYFPDFDAGKYLLSKNYVGLKITKEHLIAEFSSFLAGRPNRYLCAVENLKVNRSGANLRNLYEGILFLKWLYLQSIILPDSRYKTVHYFLTSIFQGLSERGFGLILNMINKQFALLPTAEEEIFAIINDIVNAE